MAKRTTANRKNRKLMRLEALEQRQLLAADLDSDFAEQLSEALEQGYFDAQDSSVIVAGSAVETLGPGYVHNEIDLNDDGEVVDTYYAHPNGNKYDVVLMTGASATITADPGQITRLYFLDPQDDIVCVEFEGSGELTVSLQGATDPVDAIKYNTGQLANGADVQYVKGLATLWVDQPQLDTNISVYALGDANMVDLDNDGRADQVNPDATFTGENEGVATVARLLLVGSEQNAAGYNNMGSINASNAEFVAESGVVGIRGENVAIQGEVRIHDIDASNAGIPTLLFDEASQFGEVWVHGGDLKQSNGRSFVTDYATTDPSEVTLNGFDRFYSVMGIRSSFINPEDPDTTASWQDNINAMNVFMAMPISAGVAERAAVDQFTPMSGEWTYDLNAMTATWTKSVDSEPLVFTAETCGCEGITMQDALDKMFDRRTYMENLTVVGDLPAGYELNIADARGDVTFDGNLEGLFEVDGFGAGIDGTLTITGNLHGDVVVLGQDRVPAVIGGNQDVPDKGDLQVNMLSNLVVEGMTGPEARIYAEAIGDATFQGDFMGLLSTDVYGGWTTDNNWGVNASNPNSGQRPAPRPGLWDGNPLAGTSFSDYEGKIGDVTFGANVVNGSVEGMLGIGNVTVAGDIVGQPNANAKVGNYMLGSNGGSVLISDMYESAYGPAVFSTSSAFDQNGAPVLSGFYGAGNLESLTVDGDVDLDTVSTQLFLANVNGIYGDISVLGGGDRGTLDGVYNNFGTIVINNTLGQRQPTTGSISWIDDVDMAFGGVQVRDNGALVTNGTIGPINITGGGEGSNVVLGAAGWGMVQDTVGDSLVGLDSLTVIDADDIVLASPINTASVDDIVLRTIEGGSVTMEGLITLHDGSSEEESIAPLVIETGLTGSITFASGSGIVVNDFFNTGQNSRIASLNLSANSINMATGSMFTAETIDDFSLTTGTGNLTVGSTFSSVTLGNFNLSSTTDTNTAGVINFMPTVVAHPFMTSPNTMGEVTATGGRILYGGNYAASSIGAVDLQTSIDGIVITPEYAVGTAGPLTAEVNSVGYDITYGATGTAGKLDQITLKTTADGDILLDNPGEVLNAGTFVGLSADALSDNDGPDPDRANILVRDFDLSVGTAGLFQMTTNDGDIDFRPNVGGPAGFSLISRGDLGADLDGVTTLFDLYSGRGDVTLAGFVGVDPADGRAIDVGAINLTATRESATLDYISTETPGDTIDVMAGGFVTFELDIETETEQSIIGGVDGQDGLKHHVWGTVGEITLHSINASESCDTTADQPPPGLDENEAVITAQGSHIWTGEFAGLTVLAENILAPENCDPADAPYDRIHIDIDSLNITASRSIGLTSLTTYDGDITLGAGSSLNVVARDVIESDTHAFVIGDGVYSVKASTGRGDFIAEDGFEMNAGNLGVTHLYDLDTLPEEGQVTLPIRRDADGFPADADGDRDLDANGVADLFWDGNQWVPYGDGSWDGTHPMYDHLTNHNDPQWDTRGSDLLALGGASFEINEIDINVSRDKALEIDECCGIVDAYRGGNVVFSANIYVDTTVFESECCGNVYVPGSFGGIDVDSNVGCTPAECVTDNPNVEILFEDSFIEATYIGDITVNTIPADTCEVGSESFDVIYGKCWFCCPFLGIEQTTAPEDCAPLVIADVSFENFDVLGRQSIGNVSVDTYRGDITFDDDSSLVVRSLDTSLADVTPHTIAGIDFNTGAGDIYLGGDETHETSNPNQTRGSIYYDNAGEMVVDAPALDGDWAFELVPGGIHVSTMRNTDTLTATAVMEVGDIDLTAQRKDIWVYPDFTVQSDALQDCELDYIAKGGSIDFMVDISAGALLTDCCCGTVYHPGSVGDITLLSLNQSDILADAADGGGAEGAEAPININFGMESQDLQVDSGHLGSGGNASINAADIGDISASAELVTVAGESGANSAYFALVPAVLNADGTYSEVSPRHWQDGGNWPPMPLFDGAGNQREELLNVKVSNPAGGILFEDQLVKLYEFVPISKADYEDYIFIDPASMDLGSGDDRLDPMEMDTLTELLASDIVCIYLPLENINAGDTPPINIDCPARAHINFDNLDILARRQTGTISADTYDGDITWADESSVNVVSIGTSKVSGSGLYIGPEEDLTFGGFDFNTDRGDITMAGSLTVSSEISTDLLDENVEMTVGEIILNAVRDCACNEVNAFGEKITLPAGGDISFDMDVYAGKGVIFEIEDGVVSEAEWAKNDPRNGDAIDDIAEGSIRKMYMTPDGTAWEVIETPEGFLMAIDNAGDIAAGVMSAYLDGAGMVTDAEGNFITAADASPILGWEDDGTPYTSEDQTVVMGVIEGLSFTTVVACTDADECAEGDGDFGDFATNPLGIAVEGTNLMAGQVGELVFLGTLDADIDEDDAGVPRTHISLTDLDVYVTQSMETVVAGSAWDSDSRTLAPLYDGNITLGGGSFFRGVSPNIPTSASAAVNLGTPIDDNADSITDRLELIEFATGRGNIELQDGSFIEATSDMIARDLTANATLTVGEIDLEAHRDYRTDAFDAGACEWEIGAPLGGSILFETDIRAERGVDLVEEYGCCADEVTSFYHPGSIGAIFADVYSDVDMDVSGGAGVESTQMIVFQDSILVGGTIGGITAIGHSNIDLLGDDAGDVLSGSGTNGDLNDIDILFGTGGGVSLPAAEQFNGEKLDEPYFPDIPSSGIDLPGDSRQQLEGEGQVWIMARGSLDDVTSGSSTSAVQNNATVPDPNGSIEVGMIMGKTDIGDVSFHNNSSIQAVSHDVTATAATGDDFRDTVLTIEGLHLETAMGDAMSDGNITASSFISGQNLNGAVPQFIIEDVTVKASRDYVVLTDGTTNYYNAGGNAVLTSNLFAHRGRIFEPTNTAIDNFNLQLEGGNPVAAYGTTTGADTITDPFGVGRPDPTIYGNTLHNPIIYGSGSADPVTDSDYQGGLIGNVSVQAYSNTDNANGQGSGNNVGSDTVIAEYGESLIQSQVINSIEAIATGNRANLSGNGSNNVLDRGNVFFTDADFIATKEIGQFDSTANDGNIVFDDNSQFSLISPNFASSNDLALTTGDFAWDTPRGNLYLGGMLRATSERSAADLGTASFEIGDFTADATRTNYGLTDWDGNPVVNVNGGTIAYSMNILSGRGVLYNGENALTEVHDLFKDGSDYYQLDPSATNAGDIVNAIAITGANTPYTPVQTDANGNAREVLIDQTAGTTAGNTYYYELRKFDNGEYMTDHDGYLLDWNLSQIPFMGDPDGSGPRTVGMPIHISDLGSVSALDTQLFAQEGVNNLAGSGVTTNVNISGTNELYLGGNNQYYAIWANKANATMDVVSDDTTETTYPMAMTMDEATFNAKTYPMGVTDGAYIGGTVGDFSLTATSTYSNDGTQVIVGDGAEVTSIQAATIGNVSVTSTASGSGQGDILLQDFDVFAAQQIGNNDDDAGITIDTNRMDVKLGLVVDDNTAFSVITPAIADLYSPAVQGQIKDVEVNNDNGDVQFAAKVQATSEWNAADLNSSGSSYKLNDFAINADNGDIGFGGQLLAGLGDATGTNTGTIGDVKFDSDDGSGAVYSTIFYTDAQIGMENRHVDAASGLYFPAIVSQIDSFMVDGSADGTFVYQWELIRTSSLPSFEVTGPSTWWGDYQTSTTLTPANGADDIDDYAPWRAAERFVPVFEIEQLGDVVFGDYATLRANNIPLGPEEIGYDGVAAREDGDGVPVFWSSDISSMTFDVETDPVNNATTFLDGTVILCEDGTPALDTIGSLEFNGRVVGNTVASLYANTGVDTNVDGQVNDATVLEENQVYNIYDSNPRAEIEASQIGDISFSSESFIPTAEISLIEDLDILASNNRGNATPTDRDPTDSWALINDEDFNEEYVNSGADNVTTFAYDVTADIRPMVQDWGQHAITNEDLFNADEDDQRDGAQLGNHTIGDIDFAMESGNLLYEISYFTGENAFASLGGFGNISIGDRGDVAYLFANPDDSAFFAAGDTDGVANGSAYVDFAGDGYYDDQADPLPTVTANITQPSAINTATGNDGADLNYGMFNDGVDYTNYAGHIHYIHGNNPNNYQDSLNDFIDYDVRERNGSTITWAQGGDWEAGAGGDGVDAVVEYDRIYINAYDDSIGTSDPQPNLRDVGGAAATALDGLNIVGGVRANPGDANLGVLPNLGQASVETDVGIKADPELAAFVEDIIVLNDNSDAVFERPAAKDHGDDGDPYDDTTTPGSLLLTGNTFVGTGQADTYPGPQFADILADDAGFGSVFAFAGDGSGATDEIDDVFNDRDTSNAGIQPLQEGQYYVIGDPDGEDNGTYEDNWYEGDIFLYVLP